MEGATVKESLTVQIEGGRQVNRSTQLLARFHEIRVYEERLIRWDSELLLI